MGILSSYQPQAQGNSLLVGKRSCRASVMEFILHEVFHAGGYRSEGTVCKLAGLGTFAHQVFETDFDGNMPFQTKVNQKKLAAWHTTVKGIK